MNTSYGRVKGQVNGRVTLINTERLGLPPEPTLESLFYYGTSGPSPPPSAYLDKLMGLKDVFDVVIAGIPYTALLGMAHDLHQVSKHIASTRSMSGTELIGIRLTTVPLIKCMLLPYISFLCGRQSMLDLYMAMDLSKITIVFCNTDGHPSLRISRQLVSQAKLRPPELGKQMVEHTHTKFNECFELLRRKSLQQAAAGSSGSSGSNGSAWSFEVFVGSLKGGRAGAKCRLK